MAAAAAAACLTAAPESSLKGRWTAVDVAAAGDTGLPASPAFHGECGSSADAAAATPPPPPRLRWAACVRATVASAARATAAGGTGAGTGRHSGRCTPRKDVSTPPRWKAGCATQRCGKWGGGAWPIFAGKGRDSGQAQDRHTCLPPPCLTCRKSMLLGSPTTWYSASAALMWRSASARVSPHTMSFETAGTQGRR